MEFSLTTCSSPRAGQSKTFLVSLHVSTGSSYHQSNSSRAPLQHLHTPWCCTGNPFYPDTTGTGKPDDPKVFDRLWRAGVAAELLKFRELMPHALMSGHAMDITDPLISSIFNAISIGFSVPDMIEGLKTVEDGEQEYANWMELPEHTPRITMIESAVRLQLGCTS